MWHVYLSLPVCHWLSIYLEHEAIEIKLKLNLTVFSVHYISLQLCVCDKTFVEIVVQVT